jgi:ADP-L-glycero-D-manno-heptose 6-epimerase
MRMILITGGAGCIGSRLAAALAARGTHRVVLCDAMGKADRWRSLRSCAFYELITPASLFHWLPLYGAQLDAVFHMAEGDKTDMDAMVETNMTFSTLLYRWCAENGNRLIYASSAATYGDGAEGFEDDASLDYLNRLRPLTPTGWSRHAFDRYIALSQMSEEPRPAQWAGLKFFSVYGPNGGRTGERASFLERQYALARAGDAVTLFKSRDPAYPDGGQMRDFVHVRDCVNVALWLFDHPEISGLFNVGTGHARSFLDLAQALFAALEQKPRLRYEDMPEYLRGRYRHFAQSENGRLRVAGYGEAFTPLEEGVLDTVRHLMQEELERSC